MKYVVTIFSSNAPAALDAVRAELTASGELVSSEGLLPPTDGRIVQIRNGAQMVTAGPIGESKAQLAGFLLIDVPDQARAEAVAAQVSAAVGDRVELRGTLISA
ncbi:hypothetical protein GCM10029976_057970 [Kribbella albertanoniae]|uniref:YCII-related domain-containing protein n=1 Tax=Kribbella albertanoniae TaxID=1266829 RepID=A0A4R4Q946_9ACTN|nr:YciI family protein [Kribbella albertanoniae]TDC31532.1 hypothetical protein E1261_10675 [Kribbella albertanoniae]